MKKILVMVILTLVTFSLALSQEKQISMQKQAEQDILQAEKEWRDARAKTDKTAFERLIADDYIGIAPQDQVTDKNGLIKGYRAPNLEAIESGDIKVRVYGDTAIVTGWNIRKWRIMNRESSPQERFTNVWIKRNGNWQIVSSQWTTRKEAPFNSNVTAVSVSDESKLKAVTPLGCDRESALKSLKSDTPTVIKFINSTNQPVKVYWLNYEGKRDQQGYLTSAPLPAGQSGSRNTFVTHSFVITDESGKCLGIYQPASEASLAVIK